jgi:hypothetical protein
MSKPKIFLYCYKIGNGGDVIGCALAEDGSGLASHLSSNEAWAQHDMGLTSNWKHEFYQAHYPDGFEVVWVPMSELETHVEFNKAFDLNQQKKAAAEA